MLKCCPKPEARVIKAEKKQPKSARNETSEAKRAAREEKAAVLREENQAKAHGVEQCPRCGQRFMTCGWFNCQKDGWCADREDRRRAYRMEGGEGKVQKQPTSLQDRSARGALKSSTKRKLSSAAGEVVKKQESGSS